MPTRRTPTLKKASDLGDTLDEAEVEAGGSVLRFTRCGFVRFKRAGCDCELEMIVSLGHLQQLG